MHLARSAKRVVCILGGVPDAVQIDLPLSDLKLTHHQIPLRNLFGKPVFWRSSDALATTLVRRSRRVKSRGVDNGGRELGDCSRPLLNCSQGVRWLPGEARRIACGRAQATRGSSDGGEQLPQDRSDREVERQRQERQRRRTEEP